MSATSLRTAARRSRGPAAALGGNRDFRLLWIGQLGSELGSSVTGVAMPLLALSVTGSTVAAGALATVAFAAMWLFALPGGYLADRFDGRRVMVLCDAVRALVMVLVAVSVLAGVVSIWVLVAASAIGSIASVLFGPAVSRALRTIVRRDEVPEAAAVTQARSYAADLVGPSAAGALFAVGRALPFLLDSVSFVASLACTTRLRTSLRPDPESAGKLRFWPAIGEGWSHVRRDPFLRSSVAYGTVMNLAASMLLFVPILGEGGTRHGAVVVGLTLSLAAAAGLLGAAAAPIVQRRFGLRAVLVWVAAARTVLVLGAALVGGAVALALALASVVTLSPVIGAAIGAARMVRVPEEVFGRVAGTSAFIATALQPLAPILAGVLIHGLSQGLTLGALALVFSAATLFSLLARGLDVPVPGGV